MIRRPETDQWHRWIEELELHPLDRFEYEAMLMCRDGVEEEAEIAGDIALFDRIDELDARFADLTVETDDLPFTARGTGWWWHRVPASREAREYLDR